MKDCSLSLQKNQLSYVISASHVQKAAAFAMWPKPQNRQNNMIFGEYGLPYHTGPTFINGIINVMGLA